MAHGTPLNVMSQPGWKGGLGRMDTWIDRAKSICYSPEIITTLLIGYILIQNKIINKKAKDSDVTFNWLFSAMPITSQAVYDISQIYINVNIKKASRMSHPEIYLFGLKIILNCLRNSKHWRSSENRVESYPFVREINIYRRYAYC